MSAVAKMADADGSQLSFEERKVSVGTVEIIEMGVDADAVHEIKRGLCPLHNNFRTTRRGANSFGPQNKQCESRTSDEDRKKEEPVHHDCFVRNPCVHPWLPNQLEASGV